MAPGVEQINARGERENFLYEGKEKSSIAFHFFLYMCYESK
jgi:hypothetical protein